MAEMMEISAAALSSFPFSRNADGGYGLRLGDWSQPTPVQMEIVGQDGAVQWIRVAYTSLEEASGTAFLETSRTAWAETSGSIRAKAIVTTPAGSTFQVLDDYTISDTTELVLRRTVEVQSSVVEEDAGFSSRFSLGKTTTTANGLRGREFFVPGVWYKDSQSVSPPRALAGDLNATHVLIREDRLPLPLAAVREELSGDVAALVRHKTDPQDGASFAGENFRSRLIDKRLQVGSLGFVVPEPARLELVYQFPGSEGDRTYICCPAQGPWANRSHPLQQGVRHTYQLRFTSESATVSYASMVEDVWRRAWSEATSSTVPDMPDLDKIYEDGLDLLGSVVKNYDGVPSVPFAVTIPDGTIDDTSSQMGFVGKALPAAALLLHGGLERKNTQWIDQAQKVIDFWVENSMNPSGVPRTWYNIQSTRSSNPSEAFKWRRDTPYMGHLRIASDGMQGVLSAWRAAGKEASNRPQWLQYTQQYGDFLVDNQGPNGSIKGEWKVDGTPYSNFTNVSHHSIPFLIELADATGDKKYGEAAVKAGQYAWSRMKETYHYIGGAPDNPNVLDKEAGILALKAFLALYEYNKDPEWIAAARQAASYSETWTFSWDIPMPKDDPDIVYPPSRTTLGASLVALGHSGADNFMAIASYDYYCLYKLTDDRHFLDFALFLEWSTKQMLDWDGTLGYSHPGLMNEVVRFNTRRGHGAAKWFPWLTVSILDPMKALKEETGSFYLPRLTPNDRTSPGQAPDPPISGAPCNVSHFSGLGGFALLAMTAVIWLAQAVGS